MSSASALASWPRYQQQLEDDQRVLSQEDCASAAGPVNQRVELTEAARLDICAAQTLSCAIAMVDASTSNEQCGQVLNSCLQTNPIPH